MLRFTRFAFGAALLVATSVTTAGRASAQYVLFGWKLSEYQPNIANGGRANTIAVNPLNNDHIIVASETGGLFRSANQGASWTHIDALSEFYTNAVAYLPQDTTIVIATTSEDTRVGNGGGIWRSTNGGATWTQLPGPAVPVGSTSRLSAYEISIAPDSGTIYVGTQFGVSISRDRGVTWTHVDPFGLNRQVISVLAQSGGRVIVAGTSGIRRSNDGGVTWLTSTTGTGSGNISDLHSLGASPYSRDHAYAVNWNTELYYTEDGGDNWTRISGAPGGGGSCGGIAFVKAVARRTIFRPIPPRPPRSLTLYAGNRCGVSRLTATEILTTGRFNYSGTWTALTLDHSDTRHIAFNRFNTPILLATDGGLHKTTDAGATWNFVGGGTNGYNALQITEVRGQWIASLLRYDLYFGTQDNQLWASDDGGASWKNPVCCEGFFIERLHRVAVPADSKTTFVSCYGCGDYIADPVFTSVSSWPDATSPPAANPVILQKRFHAQGVDSTATFAKGFASTTNLGGTWAQYARVPEDRRDIAKVSSATFLPVMYQSIRTGWDATHNFEIDHLVRITKRFLRAGGIVTYPLMNNFGGLGINPTMFAWYQVFAVDPGNSQHLIAPDIVNEKMMETWDGANNWAEIPNLTSQITDGGQLRFRQSIFPQASAVSFSPDDPNIVGIGTWQNGVFISRDRGATWFKVPGSEVVTYATSIAWRSASDAIVSTYGRGLWRIKWGLLRPFPDFDKICKLPCTIWPWIDRGDPIEKYKQGILVFDGYIQGARTVNGVIRELFVSPGSSVVFFSDARKEHDIKITESRKTVAFAGIKAPTARRGRMRVGLTLNENGGIVGSAFADKTLTLYEQNEKEQNQDKEVTGRQDSPTAGKPYLELSIPGGTSANTVAPGAPIRITARNLNRGMTLEIAIDGVAVDKARVDEKGILVATVRAPIQFGLHNVTLRDAETGKVIDGFSFIVKHSDDRDAKRNAPAGRRAVNR